MKLAKLILSDLVIILIGVLAICGWMTVPYDVEAHASAPFAPAYTSPCEGVGRIVRAGEVESTVTLPEAETPENDAYIAPQQVTSKLESSTETLVLQEGTEIGDVFDAVSASYEQVTVNETEGWVECVPEPDPIVETDIDALIVQVAGEYGLPWELVRAVCFVESGFDPNAISVTGDYGLMQVSYVNHGWLGLTDPLDPEQNLRAGCSILKTAIENSDGDFTLALMRYNRGDAYARSQWSQGIYSTEYTEKVLERYYAYLRGEK